MARKGCRARFPTVPILLYIVEKLGSLYPQDPIEVIDVGALRASIDSAKTVFRYARVRSCEYRILLAGAKLFEELIARHPLVDGNKRFATLVLYTFLRANGFPRSEVSRCLVEDLAIKVALGRKTYRGVARWLRRCLGLE